MAWIFGKYSKSDFENSNDIEYYKTLSTNELVGKNFVVYAGGVRENIIYSEDFIVCGSAISNDDNLKLLNNADWKLILNSDKKSELIKNLNGHFIGIQIIKEELFIFSDSLGTRDLHFIQNDNEVYFSTKPEFLKKFNKTNKLKLENFATRFLFSIQLNQKSVFEGINRLTSSIRIYLNRNRFHFEDTPFIPNPIKPSENEIEEKLVSLMLSGIKDKKRLTLGLSGGLDSRLLLSLLLSRDIKNWELYSFGDESHPDLKIAQKISNKFGIKHQIFNTDINSFSSEELFKLVLQFAIDTTATSPISEAVQKMYYSKMHTNDLIILDGGFGEILRRGLFNRLIFSEKDIRNKSIDAIYKSLFDYQLKIFNPDIEKIIEYLAKTQISDLLESMPDIDVLGFENWLDLLSIRTKLVNYTGIEQARTDEYAKVITPFQQQIIFNLNFGLDINLRKNSVLFKNIIRKNSPEITKFPLVKGYITHPYNFNTIQSKLYTKLVKKFKSPRFDINQSIVLLKIKDLVIERLLNNTEVDLSIFNKELISKSIMNLSPKNNAQNNFLDWALSAIMFNGSISS